jgi:hypothetical protein
METETLAMLALRLGYLNSEESQPALELITEASKMLTTLRSRLLEKIDRNCEPSPVASNL